MTYQPGDYFVVRTNGWAAAVIRKATDSRVNHAGIITTTAGDTLEMGPASLRAFFGVGASVQHGRARGFIVTPMHRDGTPLTGPERATIVSRALAIKAQGTGYNGIGLAALFCEQRPWLMRVPLLNGWVRGKVKDVRSLFCSQQVDWCMRDVDSGRGLFDDGRDPGDVSPGDLLDLADQSNWPHPHEGPVDVRLFA